MGREAPEPRWLDAQEQHAWRQYLHASRLLEAVLDRDLVAQGLQLTEYEIIMALSEAPDRRLRMSAIADEVVQSRSRVTHTASRLERRGWVRRESYAGDRRGVELVLTDAGYAPIHACSVLENLVDPLPREDFLALGQTMGVVGRAIKNAEVQSIEKCQDVGVPEKEQPA
jgi:DNA-binding MarR family transcriptional regulator